jgi:hypothetical protein
MHGPDGGSVADAQVIQAESSGRFHGDGAERGRFEPGAKAIICEVGSPTVIEMRIVRNCLYSSTGAAVGTRSGGTPPCRPGRAGLHGGSPGPAGTAGLGALSTAP